MCRKGDRTVVCESGEHFGRTAQVADLTITAGLGLVRSLVPALRIGVVAEDPADPADADADAVEEQELVVTTGSQVHLVRIVPTTTELRVVYVVLDRDRGTVARARHALARHVPAPREAARRRTASGPDGGVVAPVIPLARRAPRRATTSIRAAGRPARRPASVHAADHRPAAAPARWSLPREAGGWSSDPDTLRRLLAALRAMP